MGGLRDAFNYVWRGPTKRRDYDAAGHGRRQDGWKAGRGSANATIGRSLDLLRARSRDLVRNDPHATKAVSTLTSNLVGTGIVPKANTGTDKLDKLINQRFEDWSEEAADASGLLDFYGLQTVVARGLFETGETLARKRPRRLSDGYPVPLQVQILEGDLLDLSRNGADGSNMIIQGVELSPLDERVGFWLLPQHPGEAFFNVAAVSTTGLYTSSRIPAASVSHTFETLRPGQVRGIPWLASVIVKLRDLGDYEEAELVRKKIEAAFTAFVMGDDGETPEGIAPLVTDADGNTVEMVEPGLIAYVRNGKEIRFNAPASVGGYGEYKKSQLQTIAAGARMTYESLTSDLSQVNYSSIRAGQVESRRLLRQIQQNVFVRLFCRPTYRWFIDAMILMGDLPSAEDRSLYSVRWAPPRIEEVDRLREAQADAIVLKNCTSSLIDLIENGGEDAEEVIKRIGLAKEMMAKVGVRVADGPEDIVDEGTDAIDARPGKPAKKPADA